MVEVVISLEDGAELDLKSVGIGKAGDDVLAFTVEGVIREHESDLKADVRGEVTRSDGNPFPN